MSTEQTSKQNSLKINRGKEKLIISRNPENIGIRLEQE